MKTNLVTAETYSHEGGSIQIKHTYLLDASKEFNEHTDGMSEDEILESAQWMDFIDIQHTKIEHEFYKTIKSMTNLDMGSSVEMSWVNNPEANTVEEAKNIAKSLRFEISANISFRLDYSATTDIEKALVAAVSLEVPGAKPESKKR